jgi:hypothetical protein
LENTGFSNNPTLEKHMTHRSLDPRKYYWELGFLVSLALVFAYIRTRHAGLYPLVFADEWLYSSFARLTPLREAAIPSYLYLSIFGLTNACGTGFLGCARAMNLAFFIAAAPFIYLTARRFCGKPTAVVVTLMCMLAPFKSYTAYFMPESLYYFAFYVLTWIALTRTTMRWAYYALATGAVLGLMTLVKVHALFLIPALAVFIVFNSWNNNRNGPWLRIGLAAAGVAVLTAFAVRFALGYAFVGEPALSLFGSFYGGLAHNSQSMGDRLLKMMAPALFNLKGHLMVMALVFALPLAAILHYALSGKARAQAGIAIAPIYVYAILMIGAAFTMTVFYTASIVDFGPGEILRLHLRYYSFTFPLLLIVVAAGIGGPSDSPRPALPIAICLALTAAIVYSAVTLPSAYHLSMVDGPELASMGLGRTFGTVVIALELGLLLVWALNRKLAAALFVFLFLPLSVINSEIVTSKFLTATKVPNLFDKAGTFTRGYIDDAERKDLAIAGTGLGELLRTKFHIDHTGPAIIELEKGAPLQAAEVPVRKKWLLVVGDHALPPELKPVVKNAEFTLTPIATAADYQPIGSVMLATPLESSLLAGAEGLSGAEAWGRWSDSKQVRLHFKAPLPKHLKLFLKAQSFGPNANQPYTLRVGRSETSFRIPQTPLEIYLQLETDGSRKTLTIDIPQPVAPKTLGLSADERELGLGLISLEIGKRREN